MEHLKRGGLAAGGLRFLPTDDLLRLLRTLQSRAPLHGDGSPARDVEPRVDAASAVRLLLRSLECRDR